MNLQNDLRYVHRDEFASGGDYGGRTRRGQEWSRSGLIGADIRKRFVAVAMREDTVFVHGGLDPSILQDGLSPFDALEDLNAKVRVLFDTEVVQMRHHLLNDQ